MALIGVLGLALALLFSVANVFFRDFSKVTQTLTQFITFSVPMIYPFSLVEERFGKVPWVADVYLLNPLAEAVLLMQRCFWVGTDRPRGGASRAPAADLCARGLVMLASRWSPWCWRRCGSASSSAGSRSASDDPLHRGRQRHQVVHDAVPPLAEADGARAGARPEDPRPFNAVDDVSFTVEQGESVG